MLKGSGKFTEKKHLGFSEKRQSYIEKTHSWWKYAININCESTRDAVSLQQFASKWRRIDRLNTQQLILKKKPKFEKRKLSMEIVMEEVKPI